MLRNHFEVSDIADSWCVPLQFKNIRVIPIISVMLIDCPAHETRALRIHLDILMFNSRAVPPAGYVVLVRARIYTRLSESGHRGMLCR